MLLAFLIFRLLGSFLGVFSAKSVKLILIQTFFLGIQDFIIVVVSFFLVYYFIAWSYSIRWQRTRIFLRLFFILIFVFSAVIVLNLLSNNESESWSQYSAITYSFAFVGVILSFYFFRVKGWVTLASKSLKKSLILYSLISILFFSLILGVSNIGVKHLHFTPVYFFCICKFMAVIYLVTSIRVLYVCILSLPTSEILDKKIYEFSSLSYLNRIARNINSLDEILKIVVELSRNASGGNPVWIEWYENGKTSIKYAIGLDIDVLNNRYLGSPISNFFSNIQAPQIIHSLSEIGEYIGNYWDYDFQLNSFLVVPITFDDKKPGSLVVANRYEYSFDDELLSILVAFVENLKTVMENFRMLEIFSEKERLNQELAIAREIQNKLLPNKIPELENLEISVYNQPAEEVGGDFYDFVELSDGKLCVLIGDVSGKGMSAAFYMALLKGIVMSVPAQIIEAKDFLIEINNSLFNKIDKRIHLTILVLIFDFKKGVIEVARAGHLPLILKEKEVVEQVSPKGIGIPLVNKNNFKKALETVTLQIKRGSFVVLFTDGLTEALGNNDITAGIEKLKQILQNEVFISAVELKEKILNYVTIQTKETEDDMTLITLKIK